MKLIIDQLKIAITKLPIIQNSSLGTIKNWKRAQFIILADIIANTLSQSEFLQGTRKNELGTTISNITLQRLFTDSYNTKENPDLRFLKTLDKLAIFVGYSSLNNFLASISEKPQLPEVIQTDNENLLSTYEDLIFKYCKEEFFCMLKLPNIDISSLDKYIFDNSPLKKRVFDVHTKISRLDYRLNSNENRSNFEIFDFKIINIQDNIAVVSTKEFWNIEWKDVNNNTTKVYNKINSQTYFIKKQDEIWKIWDNHNPDYNGLLKKLEK